MDPCLLWSSPGLNIIKIHSSSCSSLYNLMSPDIPILLQEAVSGDPATYLDQFVPDSVDKEAEVALTTATTWSQDTSRDKGET